MATKRQVFEAWWQQRAPRERRLLALATVVVAIAAMWGLRDWSVRERTRLAAGLPLAEARLKAMEAASAEYARLAALQPPAAPAPEALPAALTAAAGGRGLSLEVRAEPGGQVAVRGTVAFDAWVDWLAAVQADYRLRLVKATVGREGTRVKVEATLVSAP